MLRSDECKQHTTIYANIKGFFGFGKKITQKWTKNCWGFEYVFMQCSGALWMMDMNLPSLQKRLWWQRMPQKGTAP